MGQRALRQGVEVSKDRVGRSRDIGGRMDGKSEVEKVKSLKMVKSDCGQRR